MEPSVSPTDQPECRAAGLPLYKLFPSLADISSLRWSGPVTSFSSPAHTLQGGHACVWSTHAQTAACPSSPAALALARCIHFHCHLPPTCNGAGACTQRNPL
eukprot:1159121-Pelagomonas_calceolata.AAC.2